MSPKLRRGLVERCWCCLRHPYGVMPRDWCIASDRAEPADQDMTSAVTANPPSQGGMVITVSGPPRAGCGSQRQRTR